MHHYQGSAQSPTPAAPGWMVAGYADAVARARCADMAASLGEQCSRGLVFPLWHYCDELGDTGLYRFYCFEDESGAQGVGAMRFVGGTLGAVDGVDPTAAGGADDASSQTAGLTDANPGGTGLTDAPGQANTDAPGGTKPAPSSGPIPKPPPQPAPPAPAPAAASSSSSSGLVWGVIAALAVAGTIVAAAAAKHPVRSGHTVHRH